MTSSPPGLPGLARERRARLTNDTHLGDTILLVPSGLAVPIAGTDQAHDFHAHAEHYYLSGLQHEGGVLALDPADGWTLFARQLSIDDQVWANASQPLEEQGQLAGLDRALDLRFLGAWLEGRRGRTYAIAGNHDLVHNPAGYGIDNWAALEVDIDERLSRQVSDAIAAARRAKDAWEVDAMRRAAKASVAGHLQAWSAARPGQTERELQIELEAEFFRNGALRTAYGSIVGSGANGAVLHFQPSDRRLRNGDIVLIDAGAEIEGYAADVTRTFPVNGRFEGVQADIYDLVLATQQEAIDSIAPGVEYKDLHMAAAHRIAAGLRDLGILRGEPAGLVESDAHALFFPHGLGHMLGLATHDAGGCLAGREASDRFGLKYLRADLPLQPGYVVTIEPGIYFIRALLMDPARRERYRDQVDWERVDSLLDFGGIRIEDDVLVTSEGAELLTGALPRDREAVEALRREAIGR